MNTKQYNGLGIATLHTWRAPAGSRPRCSSCWGRCNSCPPPAAGRCWCRSPRWTWIKSVEISEILTLITGNLSERSPWSWRKYKIEMYVFLTWWLRPFLEWTHLWRWACWWRNWNFQLGTHKLARPWGRNWNSSDIWMWSWRRPRALDCLQSQPRTPPA